MSTAILGDAGLHGVFAHLRGQPPEIVQWIYFEGNSATWEHQDSYYLDSGTSREMAAAWIALEDIAPRAGRFFICPGSHRLTLEEHGVHNRFATNHEHYIQSVVAGIRRTNLSISAPRLNKGDALFWNAWTIHGSLDTQDAARSRSSITCHAIPVPKKHQQMQARTVEMRAERVNDAYLCRPKDLGRLKNQLIFQVEAHFPRAFYWLKRKAIVHMLTHKSA